MLQYPVITGKLHYESEIDRVVHTTADGEAFVFYGRNNDIKIGVLDLEKMKKGTD